MKAKKSKGIISFIVLLVIAISSYAQVPKPGSGRDAANFMLIRERVKIMEKFWAWKKKNVLPEIMREQGVDMWIIRNDEEPLYRQTSYREHPVYLSLLPANHEGMVIPSKFAQRSMDVPETLIFFDTGGEIEYLEPKDFAELTQMVRERDPKKIAISKKNLYIRKQKIGDSEQISVITSDDMQRALGTKYAARTVDSLHLGILWLSIIGPEQRSSYRYVQGVQNDILAEAFSNRVIMPNVTTIEDLNWWIRNRYRELHLDIDNHPTVVVLRRPTKIAEYPESAKYFRRGYKQHPLYSPALTLHYNTLYAHEPSFTFAVPE